MQAYADQNHLLSDKVAFEKVVEPHLDHLKSYCHSLTKSHFDGEDLLQDTLIKAFQKWGIQPENMSKAYLFRIASNAWIDTHRKHKPVVDHYSELATIPERKCQDRAAIEEAMGILLKELTPKQRLIFLLTEGFNYTHREIAGMIDCKEGAVRAVCHRARNKLKARWEKSDDFIFQNDEINKYVHVFYSSSPEQFITLYKQEIGEMKASISVKETFTNKAIKAFSGNYSFYCLVPIILRNGQILYLPFYRSEINILLAWIEEHRTALQKTATLCA